MDDKLSELFREAGPFGVIIWVQAKWLDYADRIDLPATTTALAGTVLLLATMLLAFIPAAVAWLAAGLVFAVRDFALWVWNRRPADVEADRNG